MKKYLILGAALCLALAPLSAYGDPFTSYSDDYKVSDHESLTAEYDREYSDKPAVTRDDDLTEKEEDVPATEEASAVTETVPEPKANLKQDAAKSYSSYETPSYNDHDTYKAESPKDYDFGYVEEDEKKTSPRTGLFLSASSFQTTQDLQEFIKTTQLDHINGMFTFGGDIFYAGIAGGVEVVDETLSNVINNTWSVGPVVGFSVPLTEHIRPFAQAGIDIFFDGFFAFKAGAGFDYMLTKHLGVTFDWNYNWKYDTSVIFYGDADGNLVFNTNVDTRKYFENPFTQYHAFSTGISITW